MPVGVARHADAVGEQEDGVLAGPGVGDARRTAPTADHAYDYRVTGGGFPVKVRVADTNYRDDSGQIDVWVEPTGPGTT